MTTGRRKLARTPGIVKTETDGAGGAQRRGGPPPPGGGGLIRRHARDARVC